ncbi:MAG: zinc ribbon domain-containing protein [Ruminococcaceae bacterium]|nr:zinc ribbon domain-containing protein [Oscillospiraceae bacterium]
MFCPNCGVKLPDEAQFCGECGASLSASKEQISATQVTAPVTVTNPVPVKVVTPRQPMSKETKTKLLFSLVLTLLYAGISLFVIFSLNLKNSILINGNYQGDFSEGLTLADFLSVLINGNRLFSPTILSKAIGVSAYIFIFATPVAAFIALVMSFVGKRFYALHIMSSIISCISIGLIGASVPVSFLLIEGFEENLAVSYGVFADNLQSVTYIKLLIFASVALLFVIATLIVTAVYSRKRRVKR